MSKPPAKTAPKKAAVSAAAKPAVTAKPAKTGKPVTAAAVPASAVTKAAASHAKTAPAPKAAAAPPKLVKAAKEPPAKPAAAVAAAAPVVPAPVVVKSVELGGKVSRAVRAAAAAVAPASEPTHRFSDRFGPAKSMSRAHPEPMDYVRPVTKIDPKLANAWKTRAGRDLSEPELLAMPESEYMNEKQIEFFRGRLQTQKDDLLSNAGETTEHLREDTSIVPDPADRATIEEEHALELRTRDRKRKLLKKITQALGRLDNGDYGFCDETGEPIGLPRLLARPTATLSLEAQQRRELKQKMFGD